MSTISNTSLTGGLDVQGIVKALTDAESGKLNKLKAKQQSNTDEINLNNTVLTKISQVKDLFNKVKSAASSTNATPDSIASAMDAFVSGFNDLSHMRKSVDREAKDAIDSFKKSFMDMSSSNNLVALGASTNRDGSISMDDTKISQYSGNLKDIINVLSDNINTSSLSLSSYSSSISRKINTLQANNLTISNNIDMEQANLDRKAQLWTAQYAKVDSAIGSMSSIGLNLNKLG